MAKEKNKLELFVELNELKNELSMSKAALESAERAARNAEYQFKKANEEIEKANVESRRFQDRIDAMKTLILSTLYIKFGIDELDHFDTEQSDPDIRLLSRLIVIGNGRYDSLSSSYSPNRPFLKMLPMGNKF